MIDFSIMRKFGSTNARLKEIFTAMPQPDQRPKDPELEKDIEMRGRMEDWILHVLNEHMGFALKNYKFYAACDLAWDSTAITKEMIPLLLYAQGKIRLENVIHDLKDCPNKDAFIRKNDKGEPVGIDLPKFIDTQINIVRSIITRRLAVQSNKYSNLWPFYKLEPRGTGNVSKLRADIMSQLIDIMVDNFDYRHHDVQVMRDCFLYGHSLDFVRASWEVYRQWRKKAVQPEMESDDFEIEDYIVKEGIGWVNPHPSRTFWDNSRPLSSINSDTGCEFVGFWDACRYGQIAENPNYFNRDRIPYQRSQGLWGLWATYPAYFNQYLTQITPPAPLFADPASENDRQSNIGLYSGDLREASIFVAEIYRKIVPRDWRCGEYPWPVWVRMKVASDKTIIFAEIMPSTPAAYCGYNEADARQINVATAHSLLAYQDQMSNLVSALLLTIQAELTKIYGINTDAVTKEDQIKLIRQKLQGTNYSVTPTVIEYSSARAQELGVDPKDVIKVTETRAGQSITSIIQAMGQLMSLVERLEAMSPNEQGQPAPREISATEATEIANTTNSVQSYISDSFDEYRAAKKRIVYESYMACAQDDFVAPVMERYTDQTILEAGLTPVKGEEENDKGPHRRHTLLGTKKVLRHNYYFTTRDGAERSVNTQAANTLVQLVAQAVNIPTILQAMGKEKLYDLFNEIFRMSGSGVDLKLQLKEGEDDSFGPDQVQQLTQFVQQLAQAVKTDTSDMANLKQMLPQLAQAVKQNTSDIHNIHGQLPVKESITIAYRDAPDEIRRQMEAKAGFSPANHPANAAAPAPPASNPPSTP